MNQIYLTLDAPLAVLSSYHYTPQNGCLSYLVGALMFSVTLLIIFCFSVCGLIIIHIVLTRFERYLLHANLRSHVLDYTVPEVLTGSFVAVLMSCMHGWFDSISAHAVSLQADRADWKGFVYRSFYI